MNGFERFIYILLLTFLFISFPHCVHSEDIKLSVVVSSSIRPYRLALEGLRSHFNRPIDPIYVNDNPELALYQVSEARPGYVVTIGQKAASLMTSLENKLYRHLALVVLDIKDKDFFTPGKTCGVDLRVPVDVQLKLISEKLGEKRRVGIIYNPNENYDIIQMAKEASEKLALTIIPIKVTKREEIAKTIQASYTLIDTLLFIPDATVTSDAIVTHLVKDALLHGIPSVGFNNFFVENGAVMSFDIDYKEAGALGAELVRDVLSGRSCGILNPPFEVSWNDKAWELIKKRAGGEQRQ